MNHDYYKEILIEMLNNQEYLSYKEIEWLEKIKDTVVTYDKLYFSKRQAALISEFYDNYKRKRQDPM